ncbi:YlbL family protein [Natronospora cellulosivora (SeqCode)]
MSKKDGIIIKIIGLCFIFLITIYFIPTPYMMMSPGLAEELEEIISVEDGYESYGDGVFMLTAVTSKRASVWDVLHYSLRRPRGVVIEPMEEHLPEGMSMSEYYNIMLISMENSKNTAKAVAFEKAGYDVEVNNRGVFVNEVLENGSAKGKLEKGDRIIAINDKEVKEDQDAIDFIRENEIGEEIKVTVKRDGETLDYKMETVQLHEGEKQASIGVLIYTDLYFDFPKEVIFHTERIGGASAGGMFSLEIYNQLIPQDITAGNRIAGTGTINLDGKIGEIDGVEQKVITSERNNAVLFFVPVDNYEEAIAAASTIEVIKIETIDDAINHLEQLAN